MAEAVGPRHGTGKTAREALKEFLTYSHSRIKPQETVLFCRQLASFVRVGIPVNIAISTFAEQASSQRLRAAYMAVAVAVEGGTRLSDALQDQPNVFPPIVADMVRSAEVTGNLDNVLRQAARHIEREASARARVRAAMIYPTIIAGFAILLTGGIIIFVLPKFRDLYQQLGVPIPGILSALLGFSGFIGDHALILLLALLLLFFYVGFVWRTERGRYLVDRTLLRIPVIAPLLRTAMTERFCRTLGDMLSAGVPISQTYNVVLANVQNRYFREQLSEVGPAMAAGRGLYRPLQATGAFTPAVIQMFRVGEETGHLDANLAEAADMHEEELDYRLKRLTAFLEPALILFVGVIVGFVAITLITSIYSLAGGPNGAGVTK
ncbi:MAG TPA: type II secretion system F family protein [Candidatus Dormibacteraeota bacterium]